MTTSRTIWVAALMLCAYGCALEGPFSDDQEGQANQGLTSTRLEAESQVWTTTSGDSVSASSTTLRLQADATGDYFQFTNSVPAGTYQISVLYATRQAYGNYQVQVKGTTVGSILGGSTSTSDSWQTATLGTIALSGSTVFKFVSTGKASGSTDYDLKIDYIDLIPTSGSSSTTSASSSSASSSSASSSSSATSSSSTTSSSSGGSTGGSTGGFATVTGAAVQRSSSPTTMTSWPRCWRKKPSSVPR